MTITIRLREITAAIADLTISDLAICDLDAIPEQVQEPTLYPEPVNFVSDVDLQRVTLGIDPARGMDLAYTLTYTFWFCKNEAGYTLAEHYPDMLDKALEIIATIGAADLSGFGVMRKDLAFGPAFGIVSDPAGNMGFGCQILITILEFVQG